MFTDQQNEALKAPLDRKHVADRQQGGGRVSYVEGWHVIAEANRIFGFDGWARETVELRQLGDPYEANGKWRVNYSARVRITVQGVIRDGCGFGQGIDKDLGQAHESALKEAETDAMKRAMMTFGNPFGLALYDKSQSNVQDIKDRVETVNQSQVDKIIDFLEQGRIAPAELLKAAKVNSVTEIAASRFDATIAWLEKKLAQKEAA